MNKIYLFLLALFASVGIASAISAPENLYMVGNVKGSNWTDMNGWKPKNPVPATKKSDNGKQFLFEKVYFDQTAEFYFISSNNQDWGSANGKSYSTTGKPTQLSKGNTAEINKTANTVGFGSEQGCQFKAAEGTYDVLVDFTNDTPTVGYYNPGASPFTQSATVTTSDWTYAFNNGSWTAVAENSGVYKFSINVTSQGQMLYVKYNGTQYASGSNNDGDFWVPGSDNFAGGKISARNTGYSMRETGTWTVLLYKNGSDWYIAFTKESGNNSEAGTGNQWSDHDFYLSGDINCWSDVVDRNTDSQTLDQYTGLFSGENDDNIDFIYLQDDPQNPYLMFRSKKEMNAQWKFEYVNQGPDGNGTGWYKLDMAKLQSADNAGHKGRLCGQFKIINKDLKQSTTNQSFGVNRSNDVDYWNRSVKIRNKQKIDKNAGQNILLDNTVVEQAVVWFNPTSELIYIDGQEQNLYVYYVNDKYNPADGKGPQVYVNWTTQTNNYPQVNPFREYDNTPSNYVSPISAGYNFAWEHINDADRAITYYPYGENAPGIEYTNYWRKKIPSSIIHRTPMGFLASVKPAAAQGDVYFPRVRLSCDNLWFIEKEINVFFRFADDNVNESDATKVFFNSWLDQYDSDGVLTDKPYYLSNKWESMTKLNYDSAEGSDYQNNIDAAHQTEIVNGKTKYLNWYKQPITVTTAFANGGHAMFATNYGGFYPAGGVGASPADRASVALNGADLYYVVGGSSSRVGILYSHLKGTVSTYDNVSSIQINAEFFADGHNIYRDGDLNTHFGAEVDYQFSVTDSHGNELLATSKGYDRNLTEVDYYDENGNRNWFDAPFIEWSCPEEEGIYNVTVSVRKLVDGKYEYYNATDVYPIFATPRN